MTERRQRRAIVRRTLARIMRRCASSAFYHWLDLVDARRAAARDEEATRAAKLERARRFVLAWVKRSFSLAFIRWRSNARSIAASRTKAAKCAARLTRRRAASALSRWIEFAAESRRLRVVVRRCVQKMRRRALAGAFYEWGDKVIAKREWAAKVATAGRFFVATHQRMIYRAFNAWRSTCLLYTSDAADE